MKKLLTFILLTFLFGFASGQNDADEARESKKDTRLIFPNFKMVIRDYQVYNTAFNEEKGNSLFDQDTSELELSFDEENVLSLLIKKDTLHLHEYVFNELGRKQIQIIPKNKTDWFKISFSLQEEIHEQYDQRKFNRNDYKSTQAYEGAINIWDANKASYKGLTIYKQVKDSSKYVFRMPSIDLNVYEKKIKQRFNLRDTLIDLSGESDNIATVIYKSKPCSYIISKAYLRIDRFVGDKLKETKYILIELFYGC